jgi:zinc protease
MKIWGIILFFQCIIATVLGLEFSNAQVDYKKKIHLDVKTFNLANGLEVLVHEDHTTPLVSFQQWYRVGSRNEKPGMTGIAHFFEHLMFKGTKKFSSDDFENLIQANGGANNAFTTFDYTGYYVDLPASKIEIIFQIESDRMINLLFDPVSIQSEREVVKEERRFRLENRVEGYLSEAVFASVFKVHPYKWPVIGSMADLNSISLEQFQDFYKTYYSPNNSIIVIAGAVQFSKVKDLIQKYFGSIPGQTVPPLNVTQEPEQKSQRLVTLKKDIQNPYFTIAYKAVPAGHKDQYVMDLLSNILSEGPSSRLYKKMVYKEQLATSIYSYAYTPIDSGIFNITSSLKPGKSLDKSIELVLSEIEKLKTQAVSSEELTKAKNQVIKSYVDSLKTVSGKARAIATNQIMFGDYKVMLDDLDKYMAVTADDIQRVSRNYFTRDKSSIVKVVPNVKSTKTAKN